MTSPVSLGSLAVMRPDSSTSIRVLLKAHRMQVEPLAAVKVTQTCGAHWPRQANTRQVAVHVRMGHFKIVRSSVPAFRPSDRACCVWSATGNVEIARGDQATIELAVQAS